MTLDFLKEFEFFTGVPDSLLRPFCDYLMVEYGVGSNHIIAPNEGSATALAAGYHLATGKVPVVYLQNSGIGNIINPVASLMNDKVYGIPCLFIVGWRGEPEVPDEPQHVFQGEITLELLECMEIDYLVIDKATTWGELNCKIDTWRGLWASGKQTALVVKKDALEYPHKMNYSNNNTMSRESIIEHIITVAGDSPIVSTTGKASRELFELREKQGQDHSRDFLTVGSMGHSSSIAFEIALQKPHKKVWCIDGDGAALMHLGAMALVGSMAPKNLVHIVINNGAHETVGGLPTVAEKISLVGIAKACGYKTAVSIDNFSDLDKALKAAAKRQELAFIEVKASLHSRNDLGRPTTTAKENKESFMKAL